MRAFSARRRPNGRSAFLPALLATTALTGVAVPAVAEQAASGGLEVVTVTAEKRTENLQNVPVSVQVLGEERLQQMHVLNADDVVKLLPSVASQSLAPGFTVEYMRGIASGENNNHSGPLPTVGTYLDEQPITTIAGTLDFPYYDVARIESLTGPQGTLYGASSETGTIRIITNKPDPSRFAASYDVTLNSVDHGGMGYMAEGMVNVPLRDNMAVRIVAWDEHDAGYIDNVPQARTYPTSGITIHTHPDNNFNDADKVGGRAQFLVDLSDTWTATASIMGQTESTHGVFGYDPALGFLKVAQYAPDFAHDKWYQLALTVQGKIGNLDFTYSGGHMDRRLSTGNDYSDYTYWYDHIFGYGAYWYDNAGPGNFEDYSQYLRGKDHFTKDNHEFRLSSPSDRRFRWVVGLFYERQTHHIEQRYIIHGLNDGLEVPGWPDTIWLTLQQREDLDYAAFGQASFDITPDLTLTAGVRGYAYDNSLVGFFGFGAGYSSHTGVSQCFTGPIVEGSPCTDLSKDVTNTGETHKLNLEWRIDDSHMVYATYSTGFRPGGVNRRSDFGAYATDTLDNYEVGWKTTWDDGRLRWNGALFWEDWNNPQFSFLGPNSFTLIANAGNARSRGVETDISWLPVDGLTITAAGTYTDATLLDDFCGLFAGGVTVTKCPGPADPFNPEAPAGTRLPVTPEWKGNATARYEWTAWSNWTAHVQGTVAYQSSSTPSLRVADNTFLGKQPSFTTVDFTLGLDSENGWSVELFDLNALDSHGQLLRYAECTTDLANPGGSTPPNLQHIAVCGNQPYVVPIKPMTIGIRIGEKF